MADRDEKGLFLKGNSLAKLGGSTRAQLTNKLLERFAIRNQDGISIEELLFDIAQSDNESTEMKFKAAAKLADLVFPKTAQVEIEVDDGTVTSVQEMDDRIKELLTKAGAWEEKDEQDKD
jgi:hypothetical protein